MYHFLSCVSLYDLTNKQIRWIFAAVVTVELVEQIIGWGCPHDTSSLQPLSTVWFLKKSTIFSEGTSWVLIQKPSQPPQMCLFLTTCWSSSGVSLFQLPQQIWVSVRRPVRNRLICWGPPSTKTYLDAHSEWNLHYIPLETETEHFFS